MKYFILTAICLTLVACGSVRVNDYSSSAYNDDSGFYRYDEDFRGRRLSNYSNYYAERAFARKSRRGGANLGNSNAGVIDYTSSRRHRAYRNQTHSLHSSRYSSYNHGFRSYGLNRRNY